MRQTWPSNSPDLRAPMIRFAIPLFALALSVTPTAFVTAQTYTVPEQAAMAQIEAERPLVHAMMVATGRYDDIVRTHAFWLETMAEAHFGDIDPALWEAQIAEALTTDRIMLDFAEEVADLPITPDVIESSGRFYGSELGQMLQVVEDDIGQNRIRDLAQYEAALAAFREIEDSDDPRVALIQRMEQVLQSVPFLLDRAVAEEFAFLSGLRAADYYLDEMSDDDLRERIDVDRDAIRPSIVDYYNVYRMMLLDDFTLEELTAYADHFDTPEGQVFGDFTTNGSDAMIWAYHFEVGRVIAPIWIAQWEAEQGTPEVVSE